MKDRPKAAKIMNDIVKIKIDEEFDKLRRLVNQLPAGRERALVCTKLDEAELWLTMIKP